MLPITEQENPNTAKIDEVSTIDALHLINNEDKSVAIAVEKVLQEVAKVVDAVVDRLENGGRLFYVGTGTSGRLGVLDASEIPPTYGVSYDLVQGIIAGGYEALYKATEASEDNREQGIHDLKARGVNAVDSVIGIAASGRTPYTPGRYRVEMPYILRRARSLSAANESHRRCSALSRTTRRRVSLRVRRIDRREVGKRSEVAL